MMDFSSFNHFQKTEYTLKIFLCGKKWVHYFYTSWESCFDIESVIADLKEFPRGLEILVAGDFNTNLDQTEGDRREEGFVATLTAAELKDMSFHFLPQRSP